MGSPLIAGTSGLSAHDVGADLAGFRCAVAEAEGKAWRVEHLPEAHAVCPGADDVPVCMPACQCHAIGIWEKLGIGYIGGRLTIGAAVIALAACGGQRTAPPATASPASSSPAPQASKSATTTAADFPDQLLGQYENTSAAAEQGLSTFNRDYYVSQLTTDLGGKLEDRNIRPRYGRRGHVHP